MSGDVQPRKRKDKKKKRDDEASHGVHITKMGSDDVLLHVHEEHGTGGHWCAKIIFFSLMTILMGLVCLIILENRGLSDMDTPLSESRFSNYFDGWVDEHRAEHDDHHDSHGSVEHDDHEGHDEHDEHDDEEDHDEPFEEEADHSEGEEADAEADHDNVTPEEEDEEADEGTAENVTAEEDEEDEDEGEDNITAEVDDNITAEEDDEENVTAEEDNATLEQNDDEDDNDNNKTNEDDDNKTNEDDNVTKETSKPSEAAQDNDDDDDDAFDEEDDGTFDSFEKIVDNDGAELELLKEKARQQAEDSKQNVVSTENEVDDEANNAPSWASSQIKPKNGGGPQSIEDNEFDVFERELRRANDEMMRESYAEALKSFDRLIQKYPDKPQVYLGKAQTLDFYAEQRKSNRVLAEAISLYKKYFEFKVNKTQLLEYRSAAERCVERLRFLGVSQQALPIHTLLVVEFPDDPSVRNDWVVTLLILNRLLDAKRILETTLQTWPKDGLALVYYGFVLKQLDRDYHNASIYLRQGIESNAEGTQDGRFYMHLGESLQRLGKQNEAVEIFRKGADLKLFLSVYQRSLYNEPNLKAQPFWSLRETSYEKFLRKLENNWLAIQAEGRTLLSKTGYFVDEAENLKNKGDWKQFELFARGQRNVVNCQKAPITCVLINEFPAARDCSRGQVKFSVMHPGTHVWPHCGPTNCRLRAHLGLVVPQGTRIRVAEEERSWQEGKFLIFDDSFEHEVWHEGKGVRLVLIVDFWHPAITEQQRRTLSPI